MARERMKVVCDCGCGREVYHNQLVEVTVETPVDETLRQAKTKKRFWVTPACQQPYQEELAMMHALMVITMKCAPQPRTRWWLVNAWLNPFYPWPRILYRWWLRVGASVRVMKLQHAIYERTKGFEYARERAMQSAILCACPRFMQGFLAKRYTIKAKRKQEAAKNGKERHADGVTAAT